MYSDNEIVRDEWRFLQEEKDRLSNVKVKVKELKKISIQIKGKQKTNFLKKQVEN